MKVSTLWRRLNDLMNAGHGNKPVCINKNTFYSPLESDGAVIIGVEDVVGPIFVRNIGDDGGPKTNADGTESGKMTVVLKGGAE